ncbi:phosphatase PAP2 family protein [Candidatus Latescibacterota bacterium]
MNEYSVRLRFLAIAFLSGVFSMTIPGYANGAELNVYRLKPVKETVFFLSGFSIQQTGNYFISRLTGSNPTSLDRNDVNAIDRFASKYYSKKLSYLSDNTKDAISGLLLITSFSLLTDIRKDNVQAFITDMVMFVESETLIIGLTKCAKGLSRRLRPYAYNTNLSSEMRGSKNASMSFWSGHASLAFTTAVLTGYVFQNRHPRSRFIKPVWITGISLATATSVLRVRSGNHFPSDVIVGAAVGSFVGWIVPRLHQEKTQSLSLATNVDGTTGLVLLYHF